MREKETRVAGGTGHPSVPKKQKEAQGLQAFVFISLNSYVTGLFHPGLHATGGTTSLKSAFQLLMQAIMAAR